MGRSRLRGGNRRRGTAQKPKKKSKKRTQKLDVEDLYYARLEEEARVKQEKKRAKKLKKLEKRKQDKDASSDEDPADAAPAVGSLPLTKGKVDKASSSDTRFGGESRQGGERKKLDPFARLLKSLKPEDQEDEGDSAEETDSGDEEGSEPEHSSHIEEEESLDEEEQEDEEDNREEEDEEANEEAVDGEEEEAVDEDEAGEDDDEEGEEAEEGQGDGEEEDDEEGEDAAQSVAETLARMNDSDSDEEDDGSSSDPSSSAGPSSFVSLREQSRYRSGLLPIPGRPSPLAPLDFFWTFEESVASDESAMSRLPIHQREIVEEKKKKTPVELLHLQAAAFLQHEGNSSKAVRRKQSAAQPSAASLLLGDAEDDAGSESEQESEADETQVVKSRRNATHGEKKLLIEPSGFASYSAALPSNAADARALSRLYSDPQTQGGSTFQAQNGEDDEGVFGEKTQAAPTGEASEPGFSVEHGPSSCLSSSRSLPPSSSGLSADSYFEYILKTRIPETAFDPNVASPYGLPSSLLHSLRRLLSSRFASSPQLGGLPVAFGNAKMRSLFHFLSSYVDISFPHQNDAACSSLRLMYALHAAAHMWKARYRVSVHSNLIKRVANRTPEERQKILLETMRRQERDHVRGPRDHEEEEEDDEQGETVVGSEENEENGDNQSDGVDEVDGDTTKRKSVERSDCMESANKKQKTDSLASPSSASSSRHLDNEGPEDWLEAQVRDGGYTRPRILILLPFRSAAKEVVDYLIALMPGMQQVLNRRRYEEEFGVSREDELDQEQNFAKGKKPEDFVNIFKGNDNDRFRLGIRVAQNSLVLYSPFYASDILIASPLGLRMIVGVQGEEKREFDFLSSLEMVIIDRADVISMQNWAFLKDCLAAVNLPPVSYTSFDIRRLRPSLMAGVGASDRQTLIFSHGRDAKIQGLFKQFCSNRRGVLHLFDPAQAVFAASVLPCCFLENGKEKRKQGRKRREEAPGKVVRVARSTPCWENLLLREEESQDDGKGLNSDAGANRTGATEKAQEKAVLWKSVVARAGLTGAQQFFCKVACSQFSKASGCLLKHFAVRVLPTLQGEFDRALIVLPSYLDYCRLWRSLKEQNVDFASCHEYTSNQNITRARQKFHKGEVPILVTTVRFLFYRRYRLQGADRILFLGPPPSPEVYLHLLTHSLPDKEVAKKKRVVAEPTADTKIDDLATAEAEYYRKTGASMCFFTQYHGYAMERLLGVQKAFTLLQIPDGKVVAVK
ncbi:hypothetical protein TGPRC2_270960 [Toxoplasma gondii TgCatPRC2]|uniref:Digestive organ expansion factor-like protein n=3 Tax=Toxoplasma gondii TaxID=5811 RepID=A0A151HPC6_TOXGO|nr:hypothetical protein TGPRC2_270960 [Toxoplasma gondii TgCatPRC2]